MAEQTQMHVPTPKAAEAYHEASSFLESEAAALRRRVDDLLNYAYGVVHEGEALDRDELDGFVGSLVGSLDELTGSAYAVADAADPQQKELREWLHEANERAWASDKSGMYEVALPLNDGRRVVVYAVNADHWTVQRQRQRGEKWESDYLAAPVESPILREALAKAYGYPRGYRAWALASEREAFGQLAALRAQAAD